MDNSKKSDGKTPRMAVETDGDKEKTRSYDCLFYGGSPNFKPPTEAWNHTRSDPHPWSPLNE